MSRYLLDTTVLIDYLRGHQPIIDLVKGLAGGGHELGISTVVVAELYAGLGEKQRPLAEKLVDNLEYWEATLEISKLAGSYRYRFARQGTALTTMDALVAATAVENNAILITANAKHYPMQDLVLMKQPVSQRHTS